MRKPWAPTLLTPTPDHHPALIMRTIAGRVLVLVALTQLVIAENAKDHPWEIDFHVSNQQRDGVRRTVVNGQRSSSPSPLRTERLTVRVV